MMKEEVEVRSWHSIMEFDHLNKKQYFRDIRRLVRACYENAAREVEGGIHDKTNGCRIAAAIRRKGK